MTHPRMFPNQDPPAPEPTVYREPAEPKVDFRDVMPAQELAPVTPPDPTLVEVMANEIKLDDRRTTDFSFLLK